MKKILITLACLGTLALGSCTKNTITQVGNVATGAQLKFVQAVPGLPAVDEFVNNVKYNPSQNSSVTDNLIPISIVTGISYPSAFNTASQYGAMFPGGSSINYAVAPAGSATIKIVTSTPVPALTSPQTVKPNVTVGTITQTLADRAAYTVFTYGYPDKVTTTLIQDKFNGPDTTKAYIRFANFIPNNTAALDLKATYTIGATTTTNATVTSNIAYGTVTDFIAVPVTALGTTGYVFSLFNTGTTTAVGSAAKSINLGANRYYTIIANGLAADYVVGTTGITLKAIARPTKLGDPNIASPEIYYNPPGISYYTSK